MRKWLRRLLLAASALALTALLIAALGLWYTLDYIGTEPVGDPDTALLDTPPAPTGNPPATPAWLRTADADRIAPITLAEFALPPQRFGPWTRWWWPANLVQRKELQRELGLFAKAGLAGVEIQPFTISLSEQDMAAARTSEGGWDSPAYYDNLHFALQTARELQLGVDLNNGSGWPTGGPHIGIDDGLRQLLHSELLVSGPQRLTGSLPAPAMPLATFFSGTVGMLGDSPMQVFKPDARRLVAVIAGRVDDSARSALPWQLTDRVALDPATLQDITQHAGDGQLDWQVPDGEWAVVALWQMPGGELIAGGYAHPQPGYVTDHLDAARMRANQDYLFRNETGLAEFFGSPLRGFFNDSLEFRQERHWARGHLEEFEKRMGYDPRPYLPALVEPGADQMPFHALNIETAGEYDLGESGVRFLEDWERVTAALFRERYFKTLEDWAGERGLAHRLQAYGGPVDIVRAAGESDIPEAEQLYAGGSEMFLKAVSSGAFAAGKPIVSAESFIFVGAAFMTTPLKVKALADKAFVAGINQLVYHGTSYRIPDHVERGYPEADGWYPWQLGMISMDFSESWAFWPHAAALNRYIARNQYLLRKGTPEVDVLVYYPRTGFPQGYSNPEEPLDQGRMEGEHYALPDEDISHGRGVAWMRRAWQYTRDLERLGLTWAWADEHALLRAHYDGQLYTGALRASGLLLPDVEAMSPALAEHLVVMTSAGLPLRIAGNTPRRQRGLAQRNSGDARVAAAFAEMDGTAAFPTGPVHYRNEVVKSLRRRLPRDELLQFFSNPTAKPVTLKLRIAMPHRQALWLDAWTGLSEPAPANSAGELEVRLPAYGARTLWLHQREKDLAPANRWLEVASHPLDDWSLTVGDFFLEGAIPDDWLNSETLSHSSATGTYRSGMTLADGPQAKLRYELELGQLHGAATVRVNGHDMGSALLPPYRVEIGAALNKGRNNIEIIYTPARRNRIRAELERGAPGWDAPDLGGRDTRVSAGLIGPVRLVESAPDLAL